LVGGLLYNNARTAVVSPVPVLATTAEEFL